MQKIKIVYIDDDEEDIFLFRQHLKRLSGWEVDLLPIVDIENEIDKIFSSVFDVIFLDYYLTKTTAMEVLSVLRAFGVDVPIILLTDKEMTKAEKRTMKNLGSCDYISKSSFNALSINKILENVHFNLQYQPIDSEMRSPGIKQFSLFTNDGKLIHTAYVRNGKFELLEQETSSSTLFAASLFIVNNFITETSGADHPFNEMKTKDMTLTFERGEVIGACLVSKDSTVDLKNEVQKIIVDIETEFHDSIANFSGDVNQIDILSYLSRLNDYIY